ncbi:Bgt-4382-2, partial [Blumeria graminis f. sp. tritici]
KNSRLREIQSQSTQQPRQNSSSDDDAESANESQGDDLLRNSSKLETEELNQNVKRLVRYA